MEKLYWFLGIVVSLVGGFFVVRAKFRAWVDEKVNTEVNKKIDAFQKEADAKAADLSETIKENRGKRRKEREQAVKEEMEAPEITSDTFLVGKRIKKDEQ